MGSSSLTRDRTRVPCIGSVVSQLLDHQGSPCNLPLRVSLQQGMSFRSHRTWRYLVLWMETQEAGRKPAQMVMSPRISAQAALTGWPVSPFYILPLGHRILPLPPVAVLWLQDPLLCSYKTFLSSRSFTSFTSFHT